jgi:hypothetical protein
MVEAAIRFHSYLIERRKIHSFGPLLGRANGEILSLTVNMREVDISLHPMRERGGEFTRAMVGHELVAVVAGMSSCSQVAPAGQSHGATVHPN